MRPSYRQAINESREILLESIGTEDLVNYGRVKNFTTDDDRKIPVLTIQDQAIIEAKVGPIDQLMKLLDILVLKPDKVFDWLREYLHKMGHTDVADTLERLGAESAPASKTLPPQTANKSEKMNEDERITVRKLRFETLAEALTDHIPNVLAILKAKNIFKRSTCETVERQRGSLSQAMKIIEMLVTSDRGKVGLYEALDEADSLSLYTEIFG